MARTKLSPKIAAELEYYWRLGDEILLSDQDICTRVGVTYSQFKGWLRADAQIVRENGQREGIRSIRARARAGRLAGYLQRHHALLAAAESSGDWETAHNILCWLEAKQFPQRFNIKSSRGGSRPNR